MLLCQINGNTAQCNMPNVQCLRQVFDTLQLNHFENIRKRVNLGGFRTKHMEIASRRVKDLSQRLYIKTIYFIIFSLLSSHNKIIITNTNLQIFSQN